MNQRDKVTKIRNGLWVIVISKIRRDDYNKLYLSDIGRFNSNSYSDSISESVKHRIENER